MYIFVRECSEKKNMNHCGRSQASLTEHHGKVSDAQIVRYTWVLSLSLSLSLLFVRGFLRRPSLSGSPTDLLQRLHGYMREHNVDFIGGDFNMSAFSTVGDVFTDDEFSAPGNSLLWGLAALEEPNRECAGFLIMPKRPYEWRVHSHGCYKFDNSLLGLGPRDQSAHLPVFLHLRNTNLPGPSSVMRSEQAQQRRFERRHNKERMQRRRS